jgi:glucan phosphorylase
MCKRARSKGLEPGVSRFAALAFFSMAIGLSDHRPTCRGGLGVPVGDTNRSVADGDVPRVAASLAPRKGDFRQRLDANSHQTESPLPRNPAEPRDKARQAMIPPLCCRAQGGYNGPVTPSTQQALRRLHAHSRKAIKLLFGNGGLRDRQVEYRKHRVQRGLHVAGRTCQH